ncbi:chaperone modulator CbpM [Psychroflexus montanilacus]|uniref:chaperone modulator CbpM n=1 Tax=Psychroflexus montanilacus TaxID=2873598 RepID=UPI001CCC1CED|nr:chaperone modulator CbpM [Psychroflexus montanilacus]MBZ9650928.1 chaperone modulator CbpM [Psychroflexus montanilacus]
METTNLVLINRFCSNCDLEYSFINSLRECGLIDIIVIDDKKYILDKHFKKIVQAIYFHFELNINIEGIDVIHNLLDQINNLQDELKTTKNKLDFYEFG